MTPHETTTLKLTLAWVGALLGSVTLSGVVLLATLIFTLLQIYRLVRELWFPQAPK